MYKYIWFGLFPFRSPLLRKSQRSFSLRAILSVACATDLSPIACSLANASEIGDFHLQFLGSWQAHAHVIVSQTMLTLGRGFLVLKPNADLRSMSSYNLQDRGLRSRGASLNLNIIELKNCRWNRRENNPMLFSLPTGTEMFHFPAYAPQLKLRSSRFSGWGFPIRTLPGQRLLGT